MIRSPKFRSTAILATALATVLGLISNLSASELSAVRRTQASASATPAAPTLQMSMVYPANGVLNPGSPQSIQAEITVGSPPGVPIHKYKVVIPVRNAQGRVVRNRSYRPSVPRFLATIAMKKVPPGDYNVSADLYLQAGIVAEAGPFGVTKAAKLSPTPTATPTSTATPKTLTTSDSLLNTGSATSVQDTVPQSSGIAIATSKTNSSDQLWELYPNPWGISSGGGTINMAYSGAGAIVTTVNVTGLNNTPINAYPFIFYGGDPYGDLISGQPPHFPEQLSAMSSLIADSSYSLSGTFGGNIDILYDEYLIPSATYTGGLGGAVEVEIIPYFSFAGGEAGNFVKVFTEPVTVNGTVISMNFDEYSSGGTGGGNDIIFYPSASQEVISGEVSLNLLNFLNEAAKTAVLNSSWWVAGIEFGTEFGDGAIENYTFTVNKLQIEQTMGP